MLETTAGNCLLGALPSPVRLSPAAAERELALATSTLYIAGGQLSNRQTKRQAVIGFLFS